MILTHYTALPLTLEQRTYVQEEPDVYAKPRGLWLSDDFDFGWAEWCRGERFQTHALEHSTQFTLKEGHRVLHLKCDSDILQFTNDFGAVDTLLADAYRRSGLTSPRAIDWRRVASVYDGILITPYSWNLRLENQVRWYYGWDCASACVWNLSALEVMQVTAPRLG